MGHITVLVQHAWAMQPSFLKLGEVPLIPTSIEKPKSFDKVRILDPDSFANFIRYYQSADKTQPKLKAIIDDLFSQFENLSRRFVLQDTVRHPCAFKSLKTGTSDISTVDHDHTIIFCRQSLLTFCEAKEAFILDRCLSLLLYNLETNCIISSEKAFVSLVQVLMGLESIVSQDISDDQSCIVIKCLLLACQRIDLIRDLLSLQVPDILVSVSKTLFEYCVQIKESLGTDGLMYHKLTLLQLLLQDFIHSQKETEEAMANQVSLAFLSELVRGGKKGTLDTYIAPYLAILQDLLDKKQYQIGIKFLSTLATAGSTSPNAMSLFLNLVSNLRDIDCEIWMTECIYLLGAITCLSPYSHIRKMALEDGLLRYNASLDASKECLLEAIVVCLSEIYGLFERKPEALLAWEVLKKHDERNHAVLRNAAQRAKPNELATSRLSYLFWFGNMKLANSYSDSHNDTQYMKRVLKATESKKPMGKKPLNAKDNVIESIPLSIGTYHRNFRHLKAVPGQEMGELISEHFQDLSKPKAPVSIPRLHSKTPRYPSKQSSKNAAQGTTNARKLFNATRPAPIESPVPEFKVIDKPVREPLVIPTTPLLPQ